ncbi:MAG: DUF1501 domain-containing protein, partial [Myxococcota bacterium]|nr:DUF1501 domain-containing protein [Myxococcota bacterium]
FSRRRFMQSGSAGALGLGLALGACEEPSSTSLISGPWGTPREGGEETLLPSSVRPDGVLELFLFGAINPWDTFYVVPDFGHPDQGGPLAGTMWWTFQNTAENIPDWFAACQGGSRPLLEAPWALDGVNNPVHLGPFLYPLRDRPDIVRRMRMWVMAHDQAAHETGIPLSLCGHPQSSARMASTPAHLERFLQARDDGSRRNPWTGVIYPSLQDTSALNAEVASAVGLHRGSARPLSLRLGPNGLMGDGLDRAAVGSRRDAVDQAVGYYLDRYEQRMLRSDTGERIRSGSLDDFRTGRSALSRSDAILALLGPDAFTGASGESCGDFSDTDYSRMGLRLAVRMLTDPSEAARFVTLVDGGLLPALGGAAYDTHFRHVHHSARNLVHTFSELVSRINEPGEDDPEKLDLDRQTVLVTTEFGRTPYAVGDGLNHWSGGYVVVAIGGPFDEERSGIVGSIGEDGYAVDSITPTDLRAALLLAQGIWPFTPESFAVADISANTLNEVEAAVYLREHVLGYRL